MAELNFQVDNAALQTIKSTELKANFAEMKEALTEFIEPYTKVIVSEDAIAVAKADRAKINAVSKHIDDYRKLVKKTYSEPLKQFEDKCKELIAICDKGKDNIDEQLNAFEELRKEEKLYALRAYYEKASKENPEYITFDSVLHPKWMNKTTSLEECAKHIDDSIQRVDKEVKSIRNLHSQWETALLDEYSRTHDILAALALNERLTEKARQEAERKRREQEERERRQAELEAERERKDQEERDRRQAELERQIAKIDEATLDSELQKAITEDQESGQPITVSVYIFAFKVSGTIDDITAVKRFMESKGIQYEELL